MSENYQNWIEKGYELFAYEGPENVQVERLARQLGINKSGFYHHFGDREIFFAKIFEHHSKEIDKFCLELKQSKKIDPDYINVLIKFKTAFFMQMQLRKHLHNKDFSEAFNKTRIKTERVVVPLWAEHIKIPDNHPLAGELWDMVRTLLFMNITNENLTVDYLRKHILGFSQTLDAYWHQRCLENGQSKSATGNPKI